MGLSAEPVVAPGAFCIWWSFFKGEENLPRPASCVGVSSLLFFPTHPGVLKFILLSLEQPLAAWRNCTIYFPTYVGLFLAEGKNENSCSFKNSD